MASMYEEAHRRIRYAPEQVIRVHYSAPRVTETEPIEVNAGH